jgi:EmrB/QacA subfamily drug resistance transporter
VSVQTAPSTTEVSAQVDDVFASDASEARPRRRLLPHGHPGLVLAVILTCQLMVVLDSTIVNIALPDIQGALRLSSANLSWVINAYTLAFGGLLLLGARAGDILGRRRTFLAGIALFVAASLAGGFATGAPMLLSMRALQGVGAALASPSALALLMTMFPEGRARTRAIGLYTMVSVGGAAVGLMAGGMLTQWASWRWVLFVNVPIGLVVLVLARAVLPETTRHIGRFDLAGALTSSIGMGPLVFGLIHAASHGWADPTTLISFALGLVLLGSFVAVELRAPSPITPLRLFADRNRASSYLIRLFMVAGMMGMFFFLTLFLQDVLGYSSLKTGFAFLPMTVFVFTGSQLSARTAHRLNARAVILVGLTFSTTGLLWLSQLSQTSSYQSLLGPLVLFGLGNGLAFVPLTTLSLSGVDRQDAGAASGLVNVMQQVGGALGLAVLVTVFTTVSKNDAAQHSARTALQQAHHAFVAGADRGFLVAATLLAASWLLVATVVRTPQNAVSTERALID